MWYVYIAEFAGGRLYTGITTDPERRITQHNRGRGAKAVRGKGLVKLVYLEPQSDKITAAKREYEIKRMKRSEKLKIVRS